MNAARFRIAVAAGCVAAIGVTPALADNWLTGPYTAVVDHIIDGDTIAVHAAVWVDVNVDVNVRLEGIDAPEIRRPDCDAERTLGESARAFLESLNLETLILEDVRHDKYAGRVVARVMTPEGRNLSDLLVEGGYAAPIEPNPDWCPAEPEEPEPAEPGGD